MTVFVPQVPSKHDSATGLWIPNVNLDPARKYGDIEVMLPPQANRLHSAPLVKVIRDKMKNFNRADCLVALGDPTLIAAAACIAAQKTDGFLRMLKWDRHSLDYILVEIDL